jgi:hypothetical protein
MSDKWVKEGQKQLDSMLITLHRNGFIALDPPPEETSEENQDNSKITNGNEGERKIEFKTAAPTVRLPELMKLRGVNPLYGLFLLQHLGKANTAEKIQALESLLELPTSLGPVIRVPKKDILPNGPLADEFLDPKLLELGLASVDELVQKSEEEEHAEWEERRRFGGDYPEERKFVIPLAEKLQRLFEFEYPAVDVRITSVWAAGEIILEFNGDFNKYVVSKSLQKQEGVIFRHLLRFILLLEEFLPLTPTDGSAEDWKGELTALKEKLNVCCRNVDPQSTDEILERTAMMGFDEAV